jgi:hypothetical protein
MSERIKTGIRKDASFNQNLAGVREACTRYGVEVVIARLKEMKALFYWVKNSPEQKEMIDNLVNQLEYDHYVLPRLVEEYEITEFVQGHDGSFGTKTRTIKVVVNPNTGKPTPDPLAGLIY